MKAKFLKYIKLGKKKTSKIEDKKNPRNPILSQNPFLNLHRTGSSSPSCYPRLLRF